MKKLSILICFCILMLFVDCKQNVSLGSHIENEELNDIKKRVEQHNNGTGAKYTRSRRPVSLVYFEEFSSKSEALKREIEIKSYSKSKKELLVKR